ncbi:polyprenol monophosphomannose synthase [Hymenobacter lapidiphilus]|uniref:Polyprenol monophosphomannose synthase n=1 Tax=Hymenobacter lapidiphilus TaxID=2608003 RepID=A0A7Y7PNZ8_9BACT|nr:polyprenol monophosphomannose synthase [Hymenobacter lapidiphilus]NVO31207.1 polyprenol monophosphomannose synthase [Hymenobacter lapidiphilus]
MTDGLVLIPTYNERENAELIIRKVFSLPQPFDVLIIDDGSPDGTATIVREMMAEFPDRLFLEERSGKMGLGTAYLHGFRWALARGYQYVFEMDADFSHNPEDLMRLYDACATQGYDLAIGSRYIEGVNVVNWPMNRVLMSYFASAYVRLITRMPIMDATAGFKCYTAPVLRVIMRERIRFVGYAFQIEMKWLAHKYGFRLKEVPIVFTDRTRGTSKMSKGIFKEAFFGVVQMKISSLFRRFDRTAEASPTDTTHRTGPLTAATAGPTDSETH